MSLVANADFEEQADSGQISQLYIQAVLQRCKLLEVCLADTEGNMRVGSYSNLTEREPDSKQGFELLE